MPDSGSISDEIKRFILTSVPSVPYLEAMLLLRNDPASPWDAARLSKRLYISEKAATSLLAELHEAGIVHTEEQSPEAFCFSPATESLRDIIGQLAAAYTTQLVEVTHLIHSKTGKKAQHFADAFKWRKDS
ncbi:MAG TPA: hypothetical protein VEC35_04390 [Noviherbaspirillum sp.]|nr:hypothetical protein [Noviherbaspirillum sp.]